MVAGTQFHVEKPQFQYSGSPVHDHKSETVRAMHYFGWFFVNEARKSTHKFPSADEEERHLIYNYNPSYFGQSFQVYFI